MNVAPLFVGFSLIGIAGCARTPPEFSVSPEQLSAAKERARVAGVPVEAGELFRTVNPDNNAAISLSRAAKFARDFIRADGAWFDIPEAVYQTGIVDEITRSRWKKGLAAGRPILVLFDEARTRSQYDLGRRYELDTSLTLPQIHGMEFGCNVVSLRALDQLLDGNESQVVSDIEELLHVASLICQDRSLSAQVAAGVVEKYAIRLAGLALHLSKSPSNLSRKVLKVLQVPRQTPNLLYGLRGEHVSRLNLIRLIGSTLNDQYVSCREVLDPLKLDKSRQISELLDQASSVPDFAARTTFEARHWEFHAELFNLLTGKVLPSEVASALGRASSAIQRSSASHLLNLTALSDYVSAADRISLSYYAMESAKRGLDYIAFQNQVGAGYELKAQANGFDVYPLSAALVDPPRDAKSQMGFIYPPIRDPLMR